MWNRYVDLQVLFSYTREHKIQHDIHHIHIAKVCTNITASISSSNIDAVNNNVPISSSDVNYISSCSNVSKSMMRPRYEM